jgi:phosphodiesterase/alkaline phosphatase D-like protein
VHQRYALKHALVRTAAGDLPDRFFPDMSMAEVHEYLHRNRSRTTRRSFLRSGAIAAGLAVAGPTLWRQSAHASQAQPDGVHVGHGADPTTEMTVSWSSPPGVDAAFEYGFGDDLSGGASLVSKTVSGVADRVYWHARLGGLEPGRAYSYRIEHPRGGLKIGTFTTPHPRPKSFRFVALGDMGASEEGRLVTAGIAAAEPDLVFFVGDLCYADRSGGISELNTSSVRPSCNRT